MARRDPPDTRPYDLAYDETYDMICARGPRKIIDNLRAIEGAQVAGGLNPGESGFVYFEASRTNFLIAEAVGAPSTVSDDYKAARSATMKVKQAPMCVQSLVSRPLLPHQVDFVSMAWDLRGALNASEQGTGKTATAWALTRAWDAHRALIVCPKSLCRQWKAEHEAVFGALAPLHCEVFDVGAPEKRAQQLQSLKILGNRVAAVVNYEMVKTLRKAIDGYDPDVVICDESWRLKSANAQVTKEMMEICLRAERVLLLTGTPIGNDVGDLWAQLRMCAPEVVPMNYFQFIRRYANMVPVHLGPRIIEKPMGCCDPVGLMERLAPMWWRATKATCLNLPPKEPQIVYVDLPPETAALYERVQDEGLIALGAPLSLEDERVVMVRLHQIAGGFRPTPVAPDFLETTDVDQSFFESSMELPPEALGLAWRMQELEDCPKMEYIRQWALDVLGDPSTRAIIWCKHNHEMHRIAGALRTILGEHKVQTVYAATTNEELEAAKASFNSRSEDGVQVLVGQIKKLAYGHNLQATDWNLYFSLPWSYIEFSQSQDRSHRLGRTSPVGYIFLLARGTIDEVALATLERKEDLAERFTPDTTQLKNS